MNRRSFMKVVGGVLVGVLALPSKAKYISGTRKLFDSEIDMLILCKNLSSLQRFDKSILDLPNETLNQMERLRIEAALKATNPPYVTEWDTGERYYLNEKTRT